MGTGTPHTLRVNVGEQCQYDCGYCRPGLIRNPTSNSEKVQPHEYRLFARAFSSVGVSKVRFTGGEPLLRPDFRAIVAAFHDELPHAKLALTTNGQRLDTLLDAVPPGLEAVTVHVDSLEPERYRQLMGPGNLGHVLANVERAHAIGLSTKLNVVVQRGLNDDELHDFLAWSRRTSIEVRFIELMNTGSANTFTQKHFFSGAQIASSLGATELGRRHPSDPACLFQASTGVVFGIIASDTAPFCQDCNRLRLSADGRLRGCLYEPHGVPLAGLLRHGAGEAMLQALISKAVGQKQSFHPSQHKPREAFSMSDLGG